MVMLHDEARKLLIEAWNKTHNAKEIVEYFSVNTSTVYHLENKCVKQVLKLSITLVGYPVFGLLTGGVTLSDSIDYVKAAILKEAK